MTSQTPLSRRPSSGFTPVPDVVLDFVVQELTDAELRVYLYLLRRTLGFRKKADAVSLSQMVKGLCTRQGDQVDRGVGLGARAVQRALRGLEERRLITVHPRQDWRGGCRANLYALNLPDGFMAFEAKGSAAEPLPHESDAPPHSPVAPDTTPPPLETPSPCRQRHRQHTVHERDTEHHQTGQRKAPAEKPSREQDDVQVLDDASFSHEKKRITGRMPVPRPEVDDTASFAHWRDELTKRGLTPRAARRLVAQHGSEAVREQVERFDALRKAQPSSAWRNPAGWLRRAIEEDWPEPPMVKKARETVLAAQKEKEAAEAKEREMRQALERRRRLEAIKERLSAAALIELRKEAIERLEARGADLRFGKERQIQVSMEAILEEREEKIVTAEKTILTAKNAKKSAEKTGEGKGEEFVESGQAGKPAPHGGKLNASEKKQHVMPRKNHQDLAGEGTMWGRLSSLPIVTPAKPLGYRWQSRNLAREAPCQTREPPRTWRGDSNVHSGRCTRSA